MIRGYFRGGRPYLRAEVVIPPGRDSGRPRTRRAFLEFNVDTGADVTLLGRADLVTHLGLTPTDFAPGLPSVGMGGVLESSTIDGYMVFDHEANRQTLIPVKFVTLDDRAARPHESIVGLNVLLLGTLTLHLGEVTLDLPAT